MSRENGNLKVMPYSEEMRKCGITPVSILTKLAHVVKDAGRAVELVNRLNKLNQLRDTVDNKGIIVGVLFTYGSFSVCIKKIIIITVK